MPGLDVTNLGIFPWSRIVTRLAYYVGKGRKLRSRRGMGIRVRRWGEIVPNAGGAGETRNSNIERGIRVGGKKLSVGVGCSPGMGSRSMGQLTETRRKPFPMSQGRRIVTLHVV